MNVLSKTTTYAIRALIYILNNQKTNQYLSIREISDHLDISFHFLTKIFQSLSKEGILASSRGAQGGVSLEKNPQNVLIIDLVTIFEGSDFFNKCLLDLPGCDKKSPCPVHSIWMDIKKQVRKNFESLSIMDLKNVNGRITAESVTLN